MFNYLPNAFLQDKSFLHFSLKEILFEINKVSYRKPKLRVLVVYAILVNKTFCKNDPGFDTEHQSVTDPNILIEVVFLPEWLIMDLKK